MRILLFLPIGAMLVIATACGRDHSSGSRAQAARGPGCRRPTKGRSTVPRMDRNRRRLRQRGNQGPGFRLPGEAGIHRGILRAPGPVAFPDRSAAISGGVGSGRRAARAITRPVGAGARATRAGSGGSRRRRSKPASRPTGCGSLHAARSQQHAITNRIWTTPLKTTWPPRRRCRRQKRRWKQTRRRSSPQRPPFSRPRPQSKRRASILDSRGSPRLSTGFPASRNFRSGRWSALPAA